MEYEYIYIDPVLGEVSGERVDVVAYAEHFHSEAWECEWKDGREVNRNLIADFKPD